MRARQHRAVETAVRFFQFADGVGAVDADADHVRCCETGRFRGAHAAKHGVVVHAADDQVLRRARQFHQRRVGGVHAARHVEGFQGREQNVILRHAGLFQRLHRTVGAFLAGVEFVVGVDHRVGVFPVPATFFRFGGHGAALFLADFECGHAEVRHVFHELAAGVDKTVIDSNHFQPVELGLGHDRRAEGHVRRADHEALGAVGRQAVDGRQGFLTIRYGDLDQGKALLLAGLFGERPFGLEPGFFRLLDQKTDFHFLGRQQRAAEADRRNRQGGTAQGTDGTTTIHKLTPCCSC
ncbi:hypothetical protein D3C86_942620 [compost metagenome]